jgi:hypothetical protein
MPAAPSDGMTITFSSTKQITALTLNGNTGQTIVSGVTILPANQAAVYVYRATNTTWYPLSTIPTNVPVTPAGGSIITSGTAVSSTSGTSFDFTSIPSWVKRITVMFVAVSTNGTSNYQIQIGAGSVTTSGYVSTSSSISTAVVTNAYTTGFGINNAAGSSAFVIQGNIVLNLVGSNYWTASGIFGGSDAARTVITGGYVLLGGTLDRVRITTVNGTDTFDSGAINILYE